MEKDDEEIKVTTTKARQAVVLPAMKYVLVLGIAGAALALIIAWFVMGF